MYDESYPVVWEEKSYSSHVWLTPLRFMELADSTYVYLISSKTGLYSVLRYCL